MIGTTESARVNAVLVAIKVVALTTFIILTLPAAEISNFNLFLPAGVFGGFGSGVGAGGRGRHHLLCLCRLRRGLDRG